MKVEVSYRTIEVIDIGDAEKYKPLLKEDDYKLRTELEEKLYNLLGIQNNSVKNIEIQSCYAIEIDGVNDYELLFEY